MSSDNKNIWLGGRSKHYGEFITRIREEHFSCSAVIEKLPNLLIALKELGADEGKMTNIQKNILKKLQFQKDVYDTVMTKYDIKSVDYSDRSRFFQIDLLLDYLYCTFPDDMKELKAECKTDILAVMIKSVYSSDGKNKITSLIEYLGSSSAQLERCSIKLSYTFNKIYHQVHQRIENSFSDSLRNFDMKTLSELLSLLEKIDDFMDDMFQDVELERKIFTDIINRFSINCTKYDDHKDIVELIDEDDYLLHQFIKILQLATLNKINITPYDNLFECHLKNTQRVNTVSLIPNTQRVNTVSLIPNIANEIKNTVSLIPNTASEIKNQSSLMVNCTSTEMKNDRNLKNINQQIPTIVTSFSRIQGTSIPVESLATKI